MSMYNICLDFLKEMVFRLNLQTPIDTRRVTSYSKAYEALKSAGTLEGVEHLAGIGKSMTTSFNELTQTGKCVKLEELRKLKGAPPPSVMELMKIRNVGPKRAMQLFTSGIKSMDDMQTAVKAHRINDPKLVEAYYAAISTLERVSWISVNHVVRPIVEYVNSLICVASAEFTGSFRRHRPDVRDVDVLVQVKDASKLSDSVRYVVRSVEKTFKAKIQMEGGDRKAYLFVNVDGSERQLDLNFCTPEEYGCALVHFTGSKDFNVALRKIAEKNGYKLNQYSLVPNDGGKEKQFKTEEALFRFLDVPDVPPECRDAFLLKEPAFPPVIEMEEIIADLHIHTTKSDGSIKSIDQLTKNAAELGYKVVGVSDHSNGSGNGMQLDEAIEFSNKVKACRQLNGLHVLSGVELDVRANGELDYPIESLSQFHYVILALHTKPEHQVEHRLTTAIEKIRKAHPMLALAWAHPTGRLIGSRPEADVDWGKVFKFCSINRVAIEINGQPTRLDLPDNKVLVAKRLHCKFILSSDSHGKKLMNLAWATMIARRALLRREDIVNASTKSLSNWLRGGY